MAILSALLFYLHLFYSFTVMLHFNLAKQHEIYLGWTTFLLHMQPFEHALLFSGAFVHSLKPVKDKSFES